MTPSASSPAASTPEESSTPEASDQVAAIGGTEGFTYEDGLEVYVPKVTQFHLSDTAAGGDPGQVGLKVQVRVINGTSQAVDLSMTIVNLAAGSVGSQAKSVFDSEHGVEGGFTGKVASGRSAQAVYGFAVNPADWRDRR